MHFPDTYDFTGCDNLPDQALKVLDEASEFREAAKADPQGWDTITEAMDVYQALANYLTAAFTELDVHTAYAHVFAKNWRRGYYNPETDGPHYRIAKRHAKEVGLDD